MDITSYVSLAIVKKLLLLVISSLLLSACFHNANQTTNQDSLNLAADQTNQENLSDLNLNSTESATIIENKPESIPKEEIMESQTVVLETEKGNITLRLYPDKAPNTVKNFLTKAQSGFYENLTFHRVEDWVVQGGDPDGNGTGGGEMPTELSDAPFKLGSLGVARGGNVKISNDSQFFICTKDCSWLSGQYTNFGEVTEGMDVAQGMQVGDKIISITAKE